MDVYWLDQTQADVPAGDEWLCAREAACLARLRFAKRRADWRLGRWTAKRALAAYRP
jgi:4'-phosphopantetheinyl transferase